MPKIDRILAYVIADRDEDDEGLPAVMMPNGMMFPLVGADETRMLSLREEAQTVANLRGKPVKLLRFTNFEIVDVIQPNKKTD